MSNRRNKKSAFSDLIGGHTMSSGGFPVARISFWLLGFMSILSGQLGAQTLPVEDPVLRRLWSLGMDSPLMGFVLTVMAFTSRCWCRSSHLSESPLAAITA